MNRAKLKAQEKLLQSSKNEVFLKSKILSAEFYDLHILPRIHTHFRIVSRGAGVVKHSNDSFI